MSKKLFTVDALRCFESRNGNSYHACLITRHEDGAQIKCPFTYGYGSQYEQTALEAMLKAGWIDASYTDKYWMYDRENGYPILWSVRDALRKRDLISLAGRP